MGLRSNHRSLVIVCINPFASFGKAAQECPGPSAAAATERAHPADLAQNNVICVTNRLSERHRVLIHIGGYRTLSSDEPVAECGETLVAEILVESE